MSHYHTTPFSSKIGPSFYKERNHMIMYTISVVHIIKLMLGSGFSFTLLEELSKACP